MAEKWPCCLKTKSNQDLPVQSSTNEQVMTVQLKSVYPAHTFGNKILQSEMEIGRGIPQWGS